MAFAMCRLSSLNGTVNIGTLAKQPLLPFRVTSASIFNHSVNFFFSNVSLFHALTPGEVHMVKGKILLEPRR